MIMYGKIFLVIFSLSLLFNFQSVFAQQPVRIMAYNIYEYPNSTESINDTTNRNPKFRIIFNEINPDIVAICELLNENFAYGFLEKVINRNSGATAYKMGDFVSNGSDNNTIYYNPLKFTFLNSSMVINSGNHPTLEYELYNNLTGRKLTVFGVHLSSGSSSSDRISEVNAIRNITDNLPPNSYFIAAGDFNFVYSGSEQSFADLLDNSQQGYFIDPNNLPFNNSWGQDYSQFHTFTSGSLTKIYDFIMNSQSVVNTGGINYVPNSFTIYGNDGAHYKKPINATPIIPEGQDIADALFNASDHLPVYADYTFDFQFPFSPPYPGSIVFTQVGVGGSGNDDIIEFVTLYRMDLTTLKITNNSIDSNGEIGVGNTGSRGKFDLSSTNWTDIPAGTFVRLGKNLTNDNDPSDRYLSFNGVDNSAFALQSGGEQLIAYTGSAPSPDYYIAGIHWGDFAGWSNPLSNDVNGTSYAPGTPSDLLLTGSNTNYYFSASVDDILYVTRNALTTTGNWTGSTNYLGYQNVDVGNGALPVELSTFAAEVKSDKILLNWRTETEVDNYGFEIERSSDAINFSTIGFVQGSGNSNTPKEYYFIDKPEFNFSKYYYRLKQIDSDGKYEYSKVVEADLGMPEKFILTQNYPNPFNPETKIDYVIPHQANVMIKVYDILGNEIKTLINKNQQPGKYTVAFDGNDLSSGVYIYRLIADGYVITKEMLLMK